MTKDLTAAEVREWLDYDPATGVFTWRKRVGNVPIGRRAGHAEPRGYRVISVLRCRCWEHRLAWLYVYGEWPEGELDHINRDKGDNRIVNLRKATRTQNAANTTQRKSKSGFRGVAVRPRGFEAYVMGPGVRFISLGLFSSAEEAAVVSATERQKIHGGFASV